MSTTTNNQNKWGILDIDGTILTGLFCKVPEEDVHHVQIQLKVVVDEQLKI